MSTESPQAEARPIRLSEGETEMLMKALMADPQRHVPGGLTDTQFIRLRLNGSQPTPVPLAPKTGNMVL